MFFWGGRGITFMKFGFHTTNFKFFISNKKKKKKSAKFNLKFDIKIKLQFPFIAQINHIMHSSQLQFYLQFYSLNGKWNPSFSEDVNKMPPHKTITLNCLSWREINIYKDYFANKC